MKTTTIHGARYKVFPSGNKEYTATKTTQRGTQTTTTSDPFIYSFMDTIAEAWYPKLNRQARKQLTQLFKQY